MRVVWNKVCVQYPHESDGIQIHASAAAATNVAAAVTTARQRRADANSTMKTSGVSLIAAASPTRTPCRGPKARRRPRPTRKMSTTIIAMRITLI